MSHQGAVTGAWWDPPRRTPQIVRNRYSSECRVARAGRSLGPTTLCLSPLAQSRPSRARGLLSAHWRLGYEGPTPPRPRTRANQTNRLRTKPRHLAGPSRGNSPRGPKGEARASRGPSLQETLPRQNAPGGKSTRTPPQASPGLWGNVAAKEVRQGAHGLCHAHVVTQAFPLPFW